VRAAHRRARAGVPGGRATDHDAKAHGGPEQERPQRPLRDALRPRDPAPRGGGAPRGMSWSRARERLEPFLPALRVARFALAVILVAAMPVVAVRQVPFRVLTRCI